ncbi:hypothetical protein [Kitasatospora sp. NPDC058478]|uniref:hypothetical protein n=1 Tax=unclassified Kitasatospora TaxID=2633591 RepID=UPI003666C392
MGKRRLAYAVHLDHPGTGEHLVLLPDHIPPRELAALITNPDAWQPSEDDEDDPDDQGDEEPEAKTTRARKASADTE